MDLEALLAEQIKKAVGDAVSGAIPTDAANKADVQAAVDALKAELPALIKAAVEELKPEFDRQGVGSKNVIDTNTEPTLESDPATYLLKKAESVKDVDDWSDREKGVIAGIFHRWMTQEMLDMSGER